MAETLVSSNAAVTPNSDSGPPTRCYHKNDCEEQVSHTHRNPFRRFRRCRNRGWVDEPMPEYQRHRVALLKSEKADLEEETKVKRLAVEDLEGKLKRAEARIASVKARIERLQAARDELRWRSTLLMAMLFNAGIFYAIVELSKRNA